MQFLIENWTIFVAIFAVIFMAGVAIYTFLSYPTSTRIKKVREWLLYAVTLAEKELGGGTGQIKLRTVYDMFVARFPWVSRGISFEKFSELVDMALDEMKDILSTNERVNEYVTNQTNIE